MTKSFHAYWCSILSHLILAIATLSPGIFSEGVRLCPIRSCGQFELTVHFPFHLTSMLEAYDDPQPTIDCTYPGFDLSCSNRGDTILTLPGSGPFAIRNINYANWSLLLNDPDSCLPKRLLNFSLSGSPFHPETMSIFTLLNCSSDEAVSSALVSMPTLRKIQCMSVSPGGYTIMSVQTRLYNGSGHICRVVRNVTVPVVQPYMSDLSEDVKLTWELPDFGQCVDYGERLCELQLGRSRNAPSTGLPRSAKYGIIIGVGIPGLLFILGITSCALSSIFNYHRRHSDVSTGFRLRMTSATSSPPATGLDGPTIESYPKTMLGGSRRLPKASDNTCPICLCEYEAKETLRMIPKCNHYFHANCIDEWLKMNAICPLCRNSPEGSAY